MLIFIRPPFKKGILILQYWKKLQKKTLCKNFSLLFKKLPNVKVNKTRNIF